MKDYSLINYSRKIGILLIFFVFVFYISSAQYSDNNKKLKQIIENVISDPGLHDPTKLKELYKLKKTAEHCFFTDDSVYAWLLDRIALYEYIVNKNFSASISLATESIKINTSSEKYGSIFSVINSYSNLGYYYKELMQYNKAIACFDSALKVAKTFPNTTEKILFAKLSMVYIYFQSGDYQKSIEESAKELSYSLLKKNPFYYIQFLVQHSQSLLYQNKLDESISESNFIISYEKKESDLYCCDSMKMENLHAIASAMKTKALAYEKKRNYDTAELYFAQSVNIRIKTNDLSQIASDYDDAGNFFLNSLNNFSKAEECYFKVIEYAKRDKNYSMLAHAYTNVGEANFKFGKYKKAAACYVKVFEILKAANITDITENPPASFLNLIGNKDLITVLLQNKTKLLLILYTNTKEKIYIDAALATAMLTDSVITQTRHEQSGEQTKLYWRDKTRDFFADAIEASFLANNSRYAFYFMEKSRAVLLNDKLNELGASANLPGPQATKERNLQMEVFEQQQKLSLLSPDAPAYQNQYLSTLDSKQNLENFIKSLELKYPAYFNYKYNDSVPLLSDLQKYLAVNHQSFVHYFTNDTTAYILCITAGNTKMLKLSKNDFDYKKINDFIIFCSKKESLNAYYDSFATLSNALYKKLFQPLQLPQGRVVICSDNFLLPFEALCKDKQGEHFLIEDYTFSYTYSATYLLKHFNSYPAKGNFIGFAPVTFQPALQVVELKESADALKQSASHYSNTLLYTNKEASKNNFIRSVGDYTIANVFSHASADSTNEPQLYMQDAIINVSELQMLNKPATNLIVLSACQTNVGKNATGEGIYSLARGFASAGIPAITATLWKADDQTIYAVSEKFHQYLSEGMHKDDALQKAKLDFLKNNSGNEETLPYFWANMILIGNADPVHLSSDNNLYWWIGGIAAFVIFILTLAFVLNKRRSASFKVL